MGIARITCGSDSCRYSGRHRTSIQSSAGGRRVGRHFTDFARAALTSSSYSFSTSGCLTISEFLKFTLSTIFFYRTCLHRQEASSGRYSKIDTEESSPLASLDRPSSAESSKEFNASSPGETATQMEELDLQDSNVPAWHSRRSSFWFVENFISEVTAPTVYGYGHLALLYALINNTVGGLHPPSIHGIFDIFRSFYFSDLQTRGQST